MLKDDRALIDDFLRRKGALQIPEGFSRERVLFESEINLSDLDAAIENHLEKFKRIRQ